MKIFYFNQFSLNIYRLTKKTLKIEGLHTTALKDLFIYRFYSILRPGLIFVEYALFLMPKEVQLRPLDNKTWSYYRGIRVISNDNKIENNTTKINN